MKSLRKWLVPVLIVTVLVGGGFLLYQRTRAQATSQRPTYATAVARTGDLEISVTGTGNLASSDRRVVKSAVDGKVSQLLVKEGDSVKNGQVIAVLTNPDLVQQYQQAKLDLESQRLKFEAARSPSQAQVSQVEREVDDPRLFTVAKIVWAMGRSLDDFAKACLEAEGDDEVALLLPAAA